MHVLQLGMKIEPIGVIPSPMPNPWCGNAKLCFASRHVLVDLFRYPVSPARRCCFKDVELSVSLKFNFLVPHPTPYALKISEVALSKYFVSSGYCWESQFHPFVILSRNRWKFSDLGSGKRPTCPRWHLVSLLASVIMPCYYLLATVAETLIASSSCQ